MAEDIAPGEVQDEVVATIEAAIKRMSGMPRHVDRDGHKPEAIAAMEALRAAGYSIVPSALPAQARGFIEAWPYSHVHDPDEFYRRLMGTTAVGPWKGVRPRSSP